MSRTHKDKPWKLRFPEQQLDYTHERVPYRKWSNEFGYWYNLWCHIEKPGVKTKKKRNHREYHGMPTPMWWVREFMNRPQRTRGKEWERKVVKSDVHSIIDLDPPTVSRKPYLYYW